LPNQQLNQPAMQLPVDLALADALADRLLLANGDLIRCAPLNSPGEGQ